MGRWRRGRSAKPVIMVCSFFFHRRLSYRVTPRPASFASRPLVSAGEEEDASQPPGRANPGGGRVASRQPGNTGRRRESVSDSSVTQLQPGRCQTVIEPRYTVWMYTWYTWLGRSHCKGFFPPRSS